MLKNKKMKTKHLFKNKMKDLKNYLELDLSKGSYDMGSSCSPKYKHRQNMSLGVSIPQSVPTSIMKTDNTLMSMSHYQGNTYASTNITKLFDESNKDGDA